MITVMELRAKRGNKCEWCKKREGTQRHHALMGRSKRFSELDAEENLMLVCPECHTGECVLDKREVRIWFFEIQCRRYGLPHMLEWVASLPVKLFYSKRIDFIEQGVM